MLKTATGADESGRVDRRRLQTVPGCLFQPSARIFAGSYAYRHARTPDRKYDLHRTANGWDGGTLFHDKTAPAEQTFALVVKGVIRGRSIGALDLDLDTYKPQVKRPVMSDGRIIPGKSVAKHHRQYEMVEFSWTAIPANAEIATMMKSILSQGSNRGPQKLDNALKYTLKHLDLSNPRAGVCSAEKGNQVAYSRKFSQVFGKRDNEHARLDSIRLEPVHT